MINSHYINESELQDLIDLYSLAVDRNDITSETLIRGTPLHKFSRADGGYQRIIDWCKKKVNERKGVIKKFDKQKMIDSVRLGMEAISENMKSEHSIETPERIAKMAEILFLNDKDPNSYVKLFPKGSDMPIMQKEIPFYSFCAHHHLPFYGKAAIMYTPNETNIGLSKLARIVRHFSKGFTTQEILTQKITDFLYNSGLKPKNTMVVIDATHTCMTIRGVRAPGVQTRTYEIRGLLEKEVEVERFWNYVGNPTSFGY